MEPTICRSSMKPANQKRDMRSGSVLAWEKQLRRVSTCMPGPRCRHLYYRRAMFVRLDPEELAHRTCQMGCSPSAGISRYTSAFLLVLHHTAYVLQFVSGHSVYSTSYHRAKRGSSVGPKTLKSKQLAPYDIPPDGWAPQAPCAIHPHIYERHGSHRLC